MGGDDDSYRALLVCLCSLFFFMFSVLSIIVMIWPHELQAPRLRARFSSIPRLSCVNRLIPCQFMLTLLGDWERMIESNSHGHALLRTGSRGFRQLPAKDRAAVTNMRSLLAAHAASASQVRTPSSPVSGVRPPSSVAPDTQILLLAPLFG